MGWRFRKSKSLGPLRFTVGKRGVSVSAGNRFFRRSIHTSGRVTKSMSIPGTGLSKVSTSTLGATASKVRAAGASAPAKSLRWGDLPLIVRTVLFAVAVFIVVAILATAAGAHPGGTDSSGGHTCRTNCEQYGVTPGGYHTHDSSGNAVYPAPPSTAAQAPPPTAAPTTTTAAPTTTTAAPTTTTAAPTTTTTAEPTTTATNDVDEVIPFANTADEDDAGEDEEESGATGAIALVAAIGGGIFYWRRKRRARSAT